MSERNDGKWEEQDFGWALRHLKDGGNVRRKYWASAVYVYAGLGALCIHFPNPKHEAKWTPGLDDMWAEDWEGHAED